MPHTYPNQQEALLAKVKGKTGKISDKTHEEHLKLYTGYVNKSNGILAELEKLGVPDPANPAVANQIYSTVRALKVDFTFAVGGLKNHELYFSILGGIIAAPFAAKLCQILPAKILMRLVGIVLILISTRTLLLALGKI